MPEVRGGIEMCGIISGKSLFDPPCSIFGSSVVHGIHFAR